MHLITKKHYGTFFLPNNTIGLVLSHDKTAMLVLLRDNTIGLMLSHDKIEMLVLLRDNTIGLV